jgi:uncharacterized membrane protein YkoI
MDVTNPKGESYMAISKKLIIPGLATVGVVTGVAATGLSASAESGTTSTTQNSTSSSTKDAKSGGTSTTTQQNSSTTQAQQGTKPSGPHQANGKTETELTGTDLEKATAAAKAKVSDATVERAETDADGEGTYEVHMKKSDGSMITVFLDANFNVTSTTNGPSAKGPQGRRDQNGPQQGQAPQQNTSATSSSRSSN